MIENFPKLMSDTKPRTQDAQRTPGRISARNTRPRSKGKNSPGLSSKTTPAERPESAVFSVERRNHRPRVVCPAEREEK